MTDTAPTPDGDPKDGFIEHLEHEVADFVHGAEHADGEVAATVDPAEDVDATSDQAVADAGGGNPVAPGEVGGPPDPAVDARSAGVVLPAGLPSDTRELEALKLAGRVAGVLDPSIAPLIGELESMADPIRTLYAQVSTHFESTLEKLSKTITDLRNAHTH